MYTRTQTVLYASSDRAQQQMRSLGHFFNPHATLENKLGLAAASYELLSAVPAAAAYPSSVPGWDAIRAHEAELQSLLLTYLLSDGTGVTVHGARSADPAVRVPTVSFTVAGWDSRALVEKVEAGTPFAFRWGAFYSNRLVSDVLGLEGKSGVVRVSFVHYNTGKWRNEMAVGLVVRFLESETCADDDLFWVQLRRSRRSLRLWTRSCPRRSRGLHLQDASWEQHGFGGGSVAWGTAVDGRRECRSRTLEMTTGRGGLAEEGNERFFREVDNRNETRDVRGDQDHPKW